MSKPHTPTLLRLTSGKIHPLLVGLLASAVLTSLVWVTLILENLDIKFQYFWYNSYFIITIGYTIFITNIINKSHQVNFKKLLNSANLSDQERSDWEGQMKNHRKLTIETILALIVGFLHSYFGLLEYVFKGTAKYPLVNIGQSLNIILIWLIITQSTSIFNRNLTIMNKLSRRIKVDLLNMDQFMPLTKSGIISILAFIGAYSLLFVQGIQITDIENPAILILVPSIFFMIRNALKGVKKRVSDAKVKEIELIDAAIDGDREALKSSRIKKNLDNINVIDLINYKKIIQSTFEIPVNIPTASRFIFYLIIPLLTWVAASIVDKVIDYLIK